MTLLTGILLAIGFVLVLLGAVLWLRKFVAKLNEMENDDYD